jgi:hypothetical protein
MAQRPDKRVSQVPHVRSLAGARTELLPSMRSCLDSVTLLMHKLLFCAGT